MFEAIVNSMQAIDEANEDDGEITIQIHRDTSQAIATDSSNGKPIANPPVTGFAVEDNGIGFTSDNYQAFATSDSTRKRSIGGKGVGRLLWLKAFHEADIDSTFCEDGKWCHRKFAFRLSEDGIEEHSHSGAENEQRKTLVTLRKFRRGYDAQCPAGFDTLARRIIEHFLTHFGLTSCPRIILRDEHEDSETSLNRLFTKQLKLQAASDTLHVKKRRFRIQHFRIASARGREHQLHFCAHDRSVETRNLAAFLPNLHGPLKDGEQSFVYAGYVSSVFLDEHVVPDRTRFDISDERDLLDGEQHITWDDVVAGVVGKTSRFLASYVAPLREGKLQQITEYVSRQRPQYRHILKLKPDWIDQIPADARDDELELHLFKLSQRFECELQQLGKEVKAERTSTKKRTLQKHKLKFARYLTELNASGRAKLCEYVIHRRATLDLLAESMELSADHKYKLEEAVHEVVFPMKATSGDIADVDENNLWVVDERLAYHEYLASDIELGTVGPLKVRRGARKKRADLLVIQRFDRPLAFVDSPRPFQSMTVVEFKRPMREDYTDEKNPIDQVFGYIKDIRAGRQVDKEGGQIRVRPEMPFYAYIVCTITPKVEHFADLRGFTRTPDGEGYFFWNSNLNTYAEIISYDKLISDAVKRNRIFFDKLNLPAFGLSERKVEAS